MEKFQEALKIFMKKELRETVSTAMDKHSEELSKQIFEVVEELTKEIWEWDDKKFKDIERAIKQGATYMAVRSLIDKVANEAVQTAIPKIEEFMSELQKMIINAAGQAIRELMYEELDKRQKSSDL